MKYFISLHFGYELVDFMSNYAYSFALFFHFICFLLIFVTFILVFWLSFFLSYIVHPNLSAIESHINKKIASIPYLQEVQKVAINFHEILVKLLSMDTQEFSTLETVWNLVPGGFISLVSPSSVGLEYAMDSIERPEVVIKVIGHQWFWEYNISTRLSPNFAEVRNFDELNKFSPVCNAYTEYELGSLTEEEFFNTLANLEYCELTKTVNCSLNIGLDVLFRLLSSDRKLLIPVNTDIILLITSEDVLHSFSLPQMSIKIDAVPGRITEENLRFEYPGMCFGQCSEICGPFHAFMPITVEIVSYEVFIDWLLSDCKIKTNI